MTVHFRTNKTVFSVSRIASSNRYGQENRVVVPGMTNFRIRFENSKNKSDSVNGVSSTQEANILVDLQHELDVGDILEMDSDHSKWEVFRKADEYDEISGNVAYRTYGITKKRKNN